ncbi:unnamed protein product [marine sediment metagenome]|uniref:Uncharacterized protein n=1 Tax=marine sediment metagenome TaxID=412755 RepID=X0VL74_9ZZZZ
MVGDRLPCGHPAGWMLRLRDGPNQFKYCWGCILEKTGVNPIDFTQRLVEKETPKKSVSTKSTIKKEQ